MAARLLTAEVLEEEELTALLGPKARVDVAMEAVTPLQPLTEQPPEGQA